MLPMTTVFEKCSSFITREVSDEALLLPLEGDVAKLERFYHLNGQAAHLWKLIDGKKSLRKIMGYFKRDYDVDECRLAQDMEAALSRLQKIGAIRVLR
jgi:hypothetical protein